MHSYSARQAGGSEPAGGRRAQVLTALSERIADRRADTPPQRDPDFIRRVLPAIARYTSYFTPEVRGLDRVPADGPALLVGNHSGVFYTPETWTCGQAILERRGIDEPTYVLGYDLLFAMPGVGPFLRRLGAIPASTSDITGRLQAALTRLSAEYPHPVLLGCSRITARAAARAMERARSRRHRPGSRRLPDPVFPAPLMRDSDQGPAPYRVPVGR